MIEKGPWKIECFLESYFEPKKRFHDETEEYFLVEDFLVTFLLSLPTSSSSIHLEVASDSFCFLINSSWLLVFILLYFSLFFSGFNLYCIAVTPWTQWMGRELTGIMFCVQGSCLNLVGGLSCDRSLVSDRQPIE